MTTTEPVPFGLARTPVDQFDLPAEVAALREIRPIAPMRHTSGRPGWVAMSRELGGRVSSGARSTHGLEVGHPVHPPR